MPYNVRLYQFFNLGQVLSCCSWWDCHWGQTKGKPFLSPVIGHQVIVRQVLRQICSHFFGGECNSNSLSATVC